jgi:hypothetical protein
LVDAELFLTFKSYPGAFLLATRNVILFQHALIDFCLFSASPSAGPVLLYVSLSLQHCRSIEGNPCRRALDAARFLTHLGRQKQRPPQEKLLHDFYGDALNIILERHPLAFAGKYNGPIPVLSRPGPKKKNRVLRMSSDI